MTSIVTKDLRTEIEDEFARVRREADARRTEMEKEFEKRRSASRAKDAEPARRTEEEFEDKGSEYRLKIHAEGLDPKTIEVEVSGRTLSVEAKSDTTEVRQEDGRKVTERRHFELSRRYTLPAEVNADGADSKYRDGVLEIVLPKKKT